MKIKPTDNKFVKFLKKGVNAITSPKADKPALSDSTIGIPLTTKSKKVEAEAREIAAKIAAEKALEDKKLQEAVATANAKLKAEQDKAAADKAALEKAKADAIDAARLAIVAGAQAELTAFAQEQAQRVKALKKTLETNNNAFEVKRAQLGFLSLKLEEDALTLKDTLFMAEAKFKADSIAKKDGKRTALFAAAFGFAAFCLMLGFAPVILPALGVAMAGFVGFGVALGLATAAAAVIGVVGALIGKLVNRLSRPKAVSETDVAAKAELGSTAKTIATVGGTGVAPLVKPASEFGPCNQDAEFETPPPSPRTEPAPTPTM